VEEKIIGGNMALPKPIDEPLSRVCTTPNPMVIKIDKCPCGRLGGHALVEVNLMVNPQPPFTHWYRCPDTGDPVLMSLLMLDDQTAIAVQNQILQSVIRCLLAKRWMIAFFRVEAGRVWLEPDPPLFHDFPNGDFGIAIAMLYESIKRYLKAPVLNVPPACGLTEHKITDVPMPPAPAPSAVPRVTLFGETDDDLR
jgi:hypothetical protein